MVGVGYLALWLSASRHRINQESIKLIEIGMTQSEVEALLGAPPGNYSVGGISAHAIPPPPYRREDWIGDECAVDVYFDSSGNVIGVSVNPVFKVPRESMVAKIRRWLGL
jgi:hypothetical protein